MTIPSDPEVFREKIRTLPLIDSAVFQTISLLNNPDSNFEQIIENLSPSVAARFLNIANSAYYGRPVSSVAYAVKLLGYKQMKQVLITSILMDHFTGRLAGFSFDRFQQQAHFCAAVARALGQVLEYARPEDLFTVAILHNIGKLFIAAYFEPEHRRVVALKRSAKLSTAEAERRVLGCTHAQVGAMVLERFNIPAEVCDAVRYHDAPDSEVPPEADSELLCILRTAVAVVGAFTLPADMQPSEILNRLAATVAAAQIMHHEQIQSDMHDRGYREILPGLLRQAAECICEGLRVFLPERATLPREGVPAASGR